MYCTKCGKQNPDGNHYCRFCGTPLHVIKASQDSSKGMKPKKRSEPKEKRPDSEKNNNRIKVTRPERSKKVPSKGKKKVILIAVLLVLVLVGGAFAAVHLLEGNASGGAEGYYKENGEVLSKVKASESKNIQTEEEIIKEMNSRGFDEYPVTYNYDMKGTYSKEQETTQSNDVHPMYDTIYDAGNDRLWAITTTNGTVTAYPLFHPRNSNGIEILYAETKAIYSYDTAESMFFETIPDKSVLDLRTIERINAKALSDLTEVVANE